MFRACISYDRSGERTEVNLHMHQLYFLRSWPDRRWPLPAGSVYLI